MFTIPSTSTATTCNLKKKYSCNIAAPKYRLFLGPRGHQEQEMAIPACPPQPHLLSRKHC
uniref:Uncharacterized protein n=1 Tax=Zea mays TaxID=4577 RepID=B7ZZG4_MAIZE|nr:unknown [Zea mays]